MSAETFTLKIKDFVASQMFGVVGKNAKTVPATRAYLSSPNLQIVHTMG